MSPSVSNKRTAFYKHLYLLLAWCCLILAILGALLPLLPTTPFLLASLWFSVKADSGLARWLINHRRFGPPIRRWQRERTLSLTTKWIVVTMLVVNWFGLLALGVSQMVLILTAIFFCGVILFICRIPTTSTSSVAYVPDNK